MTKKRTDISISDTWDLTVLYPDYAAWERDLDSLQKMFETPRDLWKELLEYKDHLVSPEALRGVLERFFSIARRLEKLYTYAHLLFDQDLTNSKGKTAFGLASTIFFEFQEKSSWLVPQILAIEEKQLGDWLFLPQLTEFRFYIEKIVHMKAHTLTSQEEKIISLSEKASQSPSKTFSALNNADMRFENVLDSEQKSFSLTQGSYLKYLRSPDRELRKSAFLNLHKEYQKYSNTLCELISGQVESHLFQKKARGYASCLEGSLYGHHINVSVYKNLIKTVKDKISLLHQYVTLRKNLLKLDTIHGYDLYAPVVEYAFEMPLEKGKDTVVDSVSILGDKYQDILKRGLTTERWVDAYENEGKRSGAYSSGCYDSYPYILMNYQGTLNDVMTLAHEAGHSMHSYFSRKAQSYPYADYPIFVAEVASTFNEQLLFNFLLAKAESKKEKQFLLMHELEKIHATFFRQTLFAEFELFIHEAVEMGKILTPELLSEKYAQLYTEYYGPDFTLDEELCFEWARIPHFYYNFYVYQYATGISAAIALFRKIEENSLSKDIYLAFLQKGGSQYPIDELKSAGVDMEKPDAIDSTIDYFSSLIREFPV